MNEYLFAKTEIRIIFVIKNEQFHRLQDERKIRIYFQYKLNRIPSAFSFWHSWSYNHFCNRMLSKQSGHFIGLSTHFFMCNDKLSVSKLPLQYEHSTAPVSPNISMILLLKAIFNSEQKEVFTYINILLKVKNMEIHFLHIYL